ncbi:MAG: hypothetical protein IPM53_07195 [Anaerolineaceae bacterium]|nr:hypothetical protein [Anaerolineaceae bacterium]
MKISRPLFFGLALGIVLWGGLAACSSAPAPTATPQPATAVTDLSVIATTEPTATPVPTDTAVPPPPSPLPSPTPSVTPSPSPTPVGPFANYKLILGTGSNVWESAFIDPGAVIFHEGQFHMFYNGISGWPAHVMVGYATSPDGENWTRMTDEPIFTGEGIDYTGVSVFVTSAVVADDGTWMLYFYTIDTGNFSGPGKIGRATAASPFGPFVADPTPVLLPGPEGSWDEHAVLHPSVVKIDEGYAMYYDGSRGDLAEERDRQIGLAFSEDGATWTKYDIPSTTATIVAESDPIFKPGRFGTWDNDRVMDANVMQTPDGWVMIYESSHFLTDRQRRDYGLGIAFSEDGISWTRPEDNQFLSTFMDTSWMNIFLVTAVYHENRTYLYFDVQVSGTSPTAIYYSTFDGSLVME